MATTEDDLPLVNDTYTYPYHCGDCGLDQRLTILAMTEHWRTHAAASKAKA